MPLSNERIIEVSKHMTTNSRSIMEITFAISKTNGQHLEPLAR